MQEIIYKLLYFTEIGQKIKINSSNSKEIDKIWRNLMIYRKLLKRTHVKFKKEENLIWRTQ